METSWCELAIFLSLYKSIFSQIKLALMPVVYWYWASPRSVSDHNSICWSVMGTVSPQPLIGGEPLSSPVVGWLSCLSPISGAVVASLPVAGRETWWAVSGSREPWGSPGLEMSVQPSLPSLGLRESKVQGEVQLSIKEEDGGELSLFQPFLSADPPSPPPLPFSIDSILKPDFGQQHSLHYCGQERDLRQQAETDKTDEDCPPGMVRGPHGQLWPAWVFCTRYSDRPSSGG